MKLKDFGFKSNKHVHGITCDSRQVKKGYIFAALPGSNMDGRNFIDGAINKGAIAVLSYGQMDISVPYISNKEPRLIYAQMAGKFYSGQPENLVAITGTNGKSSTADFLRQIWSLYGEQAACFGTLGVVSKKTIKKLDHTTPDAVQLHSILSKLNDDGVTHVAMEASSHGLDQRRLDSVVVKAAGFTNLTQDHYDYHQGSESYFKAKERLFSELLKSNTAAVINTDDEYGVRLVKKCLDTGKNVMEIGWSGKDIRIEEIMPLASSQIIKVFVLGEWYELELPLVGEFQVLNAILALGLAIKTGVKKEAAIDLLKKLKGVPGRMELAGYGEGGSPIFVDFAHTEDGLDKLLRSLRPHTEGNLVVVFGCGGDRDNGKRIKMGKVAAKLADRVIVTDDNPRTECSSAIRNAIIEGCPSALEVPDRYNAIFKGIKGLKPKDCLVIAGKGHEQGQIIGEKTIPFSDIDQVKLILEGLFHE